MSRRTVKPLPVAGCQLKAIFSFGPLCLCAFVPALLLCFPSIALSEWNPTNPDPLIEYHYTYDHVGNITKIEDSVKNSTSTFTYDEVNRLTSAIGPYGANGAEHTQSYSYDEVGNIVGTPNLSTDGNGNVTQIDGKTIYYDRENRPYKITDLSGTITEFGYDYSGQRVRKAVTVNGATEETLYCGNIYEVHISSTGTETQTIHIYAGAMRVASRMTDNVGGRTYYYLGDHLGSTRMMTDALRQTVQDITYEPWGNTVTESSTTYKADYKFTGQMLDDSTNLYYYGARYYDPVLRRFITPDTVIQDYYNPQDLNRYSYAWNNPLRITDPTGHYEWSQTTTKDQFYNKLYLWTQNPYFGITADAAQGVIDMPSVMMGAVGQGIEAAKGLVFDNRVTQALWGNYDSKAVDAFFFMSGAPLVQAVSNAATYSKAAFGVKTSTKVGEVFWSGIRGGDKVAAEWTAKNGGVTLETTLANRGITLPAWDASNPSAVVAWRQASQEFAQGAVGNVRVLQSDSVRLSSVWAEVEYPTLKANPNVTSITSINPETGTEVLLWKR